MKPAKKETKMKTKLKEAEGSCCESGCSSEHVGSRRKNRAAAGAAAVADLKKKTLQSKEVFALSGYRGSEQIIFKVGSIMDSFTITITGIPDIQERVYGWAEGDYVT